MTDPRSYQYNSAGRRINAHRSPHDGRGPRGRVIASGERVHSNRTKQHPATPPQSHTGRGSTGKPVEVLLNEIRQISRELCSEWTTVETEYNRFVGLRSAVKVYLDAQREYAIATKYLQELEAKRKSERKAAREEGKARGTETGHGGSKGAEGPKRDHDEAKLVQRTKEEAKTERMRDVVSAYNEIVNAGDTGLSALGDTKDKLKIGANEVYSTLDEVVELLKNLLGTYNSENIIRLKHEYEKLAGTRTAKPQGSDSSEEDDHDLDDPEYFYALVGKLHETAERIRREELEGSRKKIKRSNLRAGLHQRIPEVHKFCKRLEMCSNPWA